MSIQTSTRTVAGNSAVIYARVSSTAQTTRGDGLGSQETRCREFARMKGYSVSEVFRDDMSGSHAARPGMEAMLEFLRDHRAEKPVVIIDDVSRLARGLEAHLQLRSAIGDAGGRLESPSIEFGEDSDSILVENLLASVSQHQRQKNAEQTKNRMRSRTLSGYWCFQAPVGYRYERSSGHGKVLVRDEPQASSLQEALEGFASGRFQSQGEVKRFLEAQPDYPKPSPNGEIPFQRITDILTRPIYAGMVEAPNWNISMRKGHHEALISLATFNRNQERLKEGARIPSRKDLNADFPLRGGVVCADCGHPFTACWSAGKYRRYAYYLCHTKGCDSYRKSIPKDRIENDFEALLGTLVPTKGLLAVAKEIFRDAWSQRLAKRQALCSAMKQDLAAIDRQIAELLDRTLEATSVSLIRAYEKKIAALDAEKLAKQEALLSEGRPVAIAFEQMFEHALAFLENPHKLWNSGYLDDRRTVLKLAFAEQLAYCRTDGFRTPVLALPFKALRSICKRDFQMVRSGGLESNTLFEVLADWEEQLKHTIVQTE